MAKRNNKMNNIMRELRNGFYIEEESSALSSIAMTILEEENTRSSKPNKFGDCSLCKKNDCTNCKYYL